MTQTPPPQNPASERTVNETPDKAKTTPEPASPAAGDPKRPQTATTESATASEVVTGEVVEGATDETLPAAIGPELAAACDDEPTGEVPTVAAEPAADTDGAGPLGAELAALRSALDERTSDMQRVSAEYANYRKRVERDRLAVAEQASAQVVAALLPLLDDLDRAREHGDLVGPFATMAEQLSATLAKFGLTGFGEVGDAFDPTRHEAVAHQTSADVTVPTCVAVMRRGYTLGERLLRPALVAVADPESE